MAETWYTLVDGTHVDPSEVAPDAKGVLKHVSGGKVAFGDHGNPLTRSVDPDEERAKAKAAAGEAAKPKAKDTEAEDKPKRGYTRRDVQAKD